MRTVFEVICVGAVGLAVAVGANALNPTGLDVERDYFPKAVAPPVTDLATTDDDVSTPADEGAPTSEPVVEADTDNAAATSAEQATLDRLRAAGFQPLSFGETVEIFKDELYTYEAYMFIDARSEERFAEGHIPGAHQFDHYYAHQYIDSLLPLIQTSMKVVVYCTGGQCEDSEFATTTLTQFGVDPALLHVFAGGIDEWEARGMPIERGERNSGDITGGDGENP